MKKIIFFTITSLILFHSEARPPMAGYIHLRSVPQKLESPVKWNFSSKSIKGDLYELHLKATISSPWHMYSQATPTGGPFPSKVNFTAHPLLQLEGKTKELGKAVSKFEEVFGVKVIYYNDGVEFVQQVRKKGKVKTAIKGTVEYMVCNDTECLPPTKIPFTISL